MAESLRAEKPTEGLLSERKAKNLPWENLLLGIEEKEESAKEIEKTWLEK